MPEGYHHLTYEERGIGPRNPIEPSRTVACGTTSALDGGPILGTSAAACC